MFTQIAAEPIVNRKSGPTHRPGFSVLLCLNDSWYSWHKQSFSDDFFLPGRVSPLVPTRYHLSLLKKVVLVVAWMEGVARSAREGTSLSEEAGIMADQGDLLDAPT